ncbi:hypothetical protein IE53DRAFT_388936 [Violaceomyces palustris]|uniref:Uncharacterized protein n=1 Tax=Violaceomyces palustris TaxID=1673888 RepID=A0ACD0NSZ1_9BASI|nr:hypothetical protein IE53DRAFT_388936 [Violaceomyces palustris]
MKFTTSFITVALASLALVSANSTNTDDSIVQRDTHESGLTHLGQRDFERKARHQQLSRAMQAEPSADDNEKRDWVSKWGKLTWYAGSQLDNPACGGSRPSDDTMAVAVKKNGGYGKCGETVHIHYGGKMVSAKIVDYCAGCEWGHFDATKGVFKKLAPLSTGVLEGIHFKLFTSD